MYPAWALQSTHRMHSRLFWYAVCESLAVIGMALYVISYEDDVVTSDPLTSVQVYVLQTFFTKTGRRYKV